MAEKKREPAMRSLAPFIMGRIAGKKGPGVSKVMSSTKKKSVKKPEPRPTRPTAKSKTTKVGKPGLNRRTVKAGAKTKSTGARKTATASRRRRAGKLAGGGTVRGMGAATKGGKFTRNG